jgi:tryptophan-rich hypothetical protein
VRARNPFDRRRALGSKWTALQPEEGERHFELTSLARDAAELRCVVSGRSRRVPLEVLRDPERWRPGW